MSVWGAWEELCRMILRAALSSFLWWVPQSMMGEEGTPTQPAWPAEDTLEGNGTCSHLLPSCPSQRTELALSLTQFRTVHQLTTLCIKISIYITGVVTVSWLDPDGHIWHVSFLRTAWRKSCDVTSKTRVCSTYLGTHSRGILQLGFQNVTLHVIGHRRRQKWGLKGLLRNFLFFGLWPMKIHAREKRKHVQ